RDLSLAPATRPRGIIKRLSGMQTMAIARVARIGWAIVAAAFLLDAGCSSSSPSPSPSPLPSLALTPLVSGLSAPLGLEQANDGTGRLFVVEQSRTIRIIQNGSLLSQPFLDISSKVVTGGEMGLLGLTFHPNFQQSGKLYVNYVRSSSGQLQSV